MSKIVVLAEAVSDRKKAIQFMRSVTGLPISTIREWLESSRPLVECLLFMNDHAMVAERLRTLLELSSTGAVKLRFFELSPDESWSPVFGNQNEISDRTLSAILDAHDLERERLP